jgi:long-subunit acyl-CoA synthetase (AMP-forming)
VADAFRQTVGARGDDVAVRTRDDAISLTWSELHERVRSVASGLAARGVKRGDTVALLLSNRPEFHIADLAVMVLGGTSFSIYSTYAPNQIQFVVSDAGAKVAIVERALLDGLLAARADLPDLAHVIVLDADDDTPLGDGVERLEDVEADGADVDFDASIDAIESGDVVTLIYTSGTTGPPKGVELTHENVLSAAGVLEKVLDFPPGARVLSWLPAAHIAERGAHHYLPVVYGFTVTDCADPREVLSYLPDVRPHWFFAVPRIWEKLKAGLETMVAGLPEESRARAERALQQGIAKVRLEQAGEPVPEELAADVAKADAELLPACASSSDSTPSPRCTPAPPRCRSTCSSSSTPSASRWPSCGACPRRPAPARSTRPTGSSSAPSARPSRARRSSWPTTARCSCEVRW